MSEILIEVSDVFKSYGSGENRTAALKGLSFAIEKGEFVSVMGPSGCGKSTLLYLIGGMDTPDSGKVMVCDKAVERLNDKGLSVLRRRDVGFIFQFYNLVPNLTVEENILLPAIMDGQPPHLFSKRIDGILSMVGMADKRKAYPTELSGGQQQRTAIARAIIMQPKVLLADEPTGNLDRRTGKEVMALFEQVNKEMGVTILQVTHSLEMASCGNRLIDMEDGQIVADRRIRRRNMEE